MSQDTKRLIVGMLLALAVIMGWNYMLHILGFGPQRPQQQAQTAPSTQPASTTQAATTHPTTGATTAATTQGVLTSQPTWQAKSAATAKSATLGSDKTDDANYVMAIRTVARGASIDAVVLNQFRRTVKGEARYEYQEPYVIDDVLREDTRSMLTRWIAINGTIVDLTGALWTLESADAGTSRWTLDVVNGGGATVRIVKTYTLSKRSADTKTDQGWEVLVSHKVENTGAQPIIAKVCFNGPTAPPRELEGQPDQNVIAGYWNDGGVKTLASLLESEFTKDKVQKDLTKNDKGLPAIWAGMQSAYFNAIVRPVPAGNETVPGWVGKVWGELLNPTNENADRRRVALWFQTVDLAIAPGQSAQFDVQTYLGPKGRKVLNTEYYAVLPRDYDQTLSAQASDNFCGWICAACTWQWMINILVWLLSAFHFAVRDWGVAIILLVLLVRAILHPVTKKSQVNMVAMQKMGPKLEELKKKYKDDPQTLQREQMRFYKEHGFTPILGCLPMLLQMPIWIALWNALQTTFELRLSPFLYNLTWIHDLAKPDYLVRFDHPVPLIFGWTLRGINILPILMGVVFYLQTKLQPKPPTMTPEQESQQKMMTWMSTLMFPLLLYSGPAGLNLYILTSTAFGILESKVVRDHIKRHEELLAKMGPTIVDAPKGGAAAVAVPEKKGCLGQFMARMAAKVEEIQKQADKGRKQ